MEEIINVEGMMCHMCENKVVTNLKALKGVKKVVASAEEKNVKVNFNEKKISLDDIKNKITDLGYDVK